MSLITSKWTHSLVLNCCKKARHDVVSCISVNEAVSVVVNEPAGDVFTVLHIRPEVSLPASGEPRHKVMMAPSATHTHMNLRHTRSSSRTWSHWAHDLLHTWWRLVSLGSLPVAVLSLHNLSHDKTDLKEDSEYIRSVGCNVMQD